MRKVLIHYRDCDGYGATKYGDYTAGPYEVDRAAQIAANLEMMGCFDFRYQELVTEKA